METLNELQKKILKVFYDKQCNEDSGYFNDDETPVIRYSHLEKALSLTRERLKIEVIELRNMGIIYLGMALDYDYQFSGSGWILTDPKGANLVRELFYDENLSPRE